MSARNRNGQADRIKSICPLNFFEVGGGGGHKNDVNIVELWSKDYIHVDKLPLKFVALSHFYPTSDIRIPILLQQKGCPSKSLGGGGGGSEQGL